MIDFVKMIRSVIPVTLWLQIGTRRYSHHRVLSQVILLMTVMFYRMPVWAEVTSCVATETSGCEFEIFDTVIFDVSDADLPEERVQQSTTTSFLDLINARYDRAANRLTAQAAWLDQLFGTQVQDKPNAQLRLFVDTQVKRHEQTHIDLHLSGSVRLPNASAKLRLVFSDDPLDNPERARIAATESSSTDNQSSKGYLQPDQRIPDTTSVFKTSSVALRYQLSTANITSDADIGLRAGPDLFLRTRLGKHWVLNDDWKSLLDQTFRYGTKSNGYALTDYRLQYLPQAQSRLQRLLQQDAILNKPLSQYQVTYTYAEPSKTRGFDWVHNISQQYWLENNKTLSYGWLAAGHINNQGSQLEHNGPWVSWRQSLWQKWFFVGVDTGYFDDRILQTSNRLSILLRLEFQLNSQ